MIDGSICGAEDALLPGAPLGAALAEAFEEESAALGAYAGFAPLH